LYSTSKKRTHVEVAWEVGGQVDISSIEGGSYEGGGYTMMGKTVHWEASVTVLIGVIKLRRI
jgi:hypothetical protein